MQKKSLFIGFVLILASTIKLQAQYTKQDSIYNKYFVGSTLFMLANLVPDNNPPNMVYLNLGYRITGKDVISLEFKTWKYGWPIGIPYGKSFEADGEGFPGYIREYGVSLAYYRFLWNGLFTQVDMMPAFQTFKNENGNKIDNGFQIFNTYSIGYHIKLFKDQFFIQPSIAITHRPYQSKMPDSFQRVDDKWSRFFYGQPGLHFGYNF
ncbi:hypothetical protein [Mariniflexile maritimum]|uniref:hypothetical protein n=1 Tax=Mariniflexile maritimum TaxID=2682493 RepID=UPI0012F63B68|nr:hypothetical protein [Mariniflexile maritimum]HMR16497.1 hypothetical protein [Mariniflexile sp.]